MMFLLTSPLIEGCQLPRLITRRYINCKFDSSSISSMSPKSKHVREGVSWLHSLGGPAIAQPWHFQSPWGLVSWDCPACVFAGFSMGEASEALDLGTARKRPWTATVRRRQAAL